MFHVVFCILLLVIYMKSVVDQLLRLGKRELICLLSFTCTCVIMWFLFGKVSSSSGCLGWAALFYWGHSLCLPYNYMRTAMRVFCPLIVFQQSSLYKVAAASHSISFSLPFDRSIRISKYSMNIGKFMFKQFSYLLSD